MKKYLLITVAALLSLTLLACGGRQSQNQQSRTPNTSPADTQLIPPQADPLPAGSAPVAAAAQISEEQAVDIALNHAGLTRDQVSGLRSELERDDRIVYYEVEFYREGREYEYEVQAQTGQILKADTDRLD